jgi:hypothetical protein
MNGFHKHEPYFLKRNGPALGPLPEGGAPALSFRLDVLDSPLVAADLSEVL